MNGISAQQKIFQRTLPPWPSPSEDKETAVQKGSWPARAGTWVCDVQPPDLLRSTFLLRISYPAYTVCSVLSDSRQSPWTAAARRLCSWNFPDRMLGWAAIFYSGALPNPAYQTRTSQLLPGERTLSLRASWETQALARCHSSPKKPRRLSGCL